MSWISDANPFEWDASDWTAAAVGGGSPWAGALNKGMSEKYRDYEEYVRDQRVTDALDSMGDIRGRTEDVRSRLKASGMSDAAAASATARAGNELFTTGLENLWGRYQGYQNLFNQAKGQMGELEGVGADDVSDDPWQQQFTNFWSSF